MFTIEPATPESEETPGLKILKKTKLFVNFHLSHVNNNAGQSELLLGRQDSLDIDFSNSVSLGRHAEKYCGSRVILATEVFGACSSYVGLLTAGLRRELLIAGRVVLLSTPWLLICLNRRLSGLCPVG